MGIPIMPYHLPAFEEDPGMISANNIREKKRMNSGSTTLLLEFGSSTEELFVIICKLDHMVLQIYFPFFK